MAGDPFLSDPSRKRKRTNRSSSTLRTQKQKSQRKSESKTDSGSRNIDEEISGGSETEDEPGNVSISSAEANSGEEYDDEADEEEEYKDENAADKRRRLAKQYLDNLKADEMDHQGDDFDAKDLDDDNIGRRLQRDVAESKGHIYKFYGDKIAPQLEDVSVHTTRIGGKNMTSMTLHYPYLYTTSKDMELIKWNISQDKRKPQRVKHVKGGFRYYDLSSNASLNNHYDCINCVAASPDGRYVVTGGNDARLIIWSTENLTCLKVLDTRAAVNSITFRRGTDQLYAACSDLKVRTFAINQYSQLEVLYGHQDNITDISALSRETCVSVGSRDKSAMYWKIADESRLTFRGGDSDKKLNIAKENNEPFHSEGSIDVVSMIDETHFVTGSDNGNLDLWSVSKKKPLSVQRLAHDLLPELPPTKASAEVDTEVSRLQVPERQPYWITAVHGVPFTDVFISGSYNGDVRIWKIDREGLRSFLMIGKIDNVKGCVVDIKTVEVPDSNKMIVFVLVSKEHKYGRWLGKVGGRNSLISFALTI